MALTMLATGGVFLGGGIPPKILPALPGPGAVPGRLPGQGADAGLMETIPVQVVMYDRTALRGAAHVAAFGES